MLCLLYNGAGKAARTIPLGCQAVKRYKATTTGRPTHAAERDVRRAVNRWVRGVFFERFRGFGFSSFGGESRPFHLPITPTVGRYL